MNWVTLLLAALAETAYGVAVYHSRGFTQPWPTLWAVVSGVATTILLGLAMKSLPIGVSFVVWSGLAAIGTAIYGIAVLGEPRDATRVGMMLMILAGIVGLKFTTPN